MSDSELKIRAQFEDEARGADTKLLIRRTTMWKYLIIASGVVMATAALAQDTAAVFAALDTDTNGAISETEAERNAFVMEGFAAADSNSDGSLSQEEFDAAFG